MQPPRRLDCKGQAISPGDRVRILGVPHLPDRAPAEQALYASLLGKYKRVHGFDASGQAVFRLRRKPSDGRSLQLTIRLDPVLLMVPRRRLATTPAPKRKKTGKARKVARFGTDIGSALQGMLLSTDALIRALEHCSASLDEVLASLPDEQDQPVQCRPATAF